ncbi:MAG TPA: A24 family peptidase [Candidatus Limnocylindrales bacterium]|nr:A24 family peptidase [Candidatus Limnocylindrales bacterium]
MLTPLVILLVILGGTWGFAADRIAARWPAHDDGSIRHIDWRTPVVVLVGAASLGALTTRFPEPVPAVVFGAYLVALVLLLATDLDQRLLPDVITLPAIPLALVFSLTGLNPLVPPGVLLIAIAAAIGLPLLLWLVSIPFGAGAIGQGDLKLLVSVGLMVGPLRLVYGAVYGALLAGIVLVLLLVLRRITLKTFVPYGPFLIIGAIWAVLVIV